MGIFANQCPDKKQGFMSGEFVDVFVNKLLRTKIFQFSFSAAILPTVQCSGSGPWGHYTANAGEQTEPALYGAHHHPLLTIITINIAITITIILIIIREQTPPTAWQFALDL